MWSLISRASIAYAKCPIFTFCRRTYSRTANRMRRRSGRFLHMADSQSKYRIHIQGRADSQIATAAYIKHISLTSLSLLFTKYLWLVVFPSVSSTLHWKFTFLLPNFSSRVYKNIMRETFLKLRGYSTDVTSKQLSIFDEFSLKKFYSIKIHIFI